MASGGFFLGGMADGLKVAEELAIKRQGEGRLGEELALRKQTIANAEQRELFSRADKQIGDTMGSVAEVIREGIKAGKDPVQISKAIQPAIESAKSLAAKAGRDPNMLDVQARVWMATPDTGLKKKVVKIGSGLQGDTYGVMDEMTGEITPVDAAMKPAAKGQPNLSQSEVITPRQAQVANAPAPLAPAAAPAAPAPGPATFNDRFNAAMGATAQADTVVPPGIATEPSTLQPRNEDYLKTLDPATAALVKKIADYEIDPAKAFRGRGAAIEMMKAVAHYDPNWDMKDYQTKVRTRAQFTTGPQGQNLTSLGTIMRHMATIETAGEALDNFKTSEYGVGTKAVNQLRTWYLENKQDPRVASFETAANAVANEAERAFRGNTTAIAGIKEWRKSLNPAMSPEERKGAFSTLFDLLKGRVEEMDHAYKRGMGHAKDVFEVMSPESKALYETFQQKAAEARAAVPKAGGGGTGGWSIRRLD